MTTGLDKVELIDRVIFSRWKGAPHPDDVKLMDATMANYERELGTKLIYVGSVNPTAKVPSTQERINLQNLITATRNYCDHAYVIIEGSELQSNLIRVIISGALILTRTYGDYLSVHKDGAQVSEEITRNFRMDGKNLVLRARERGLIL
ncbi:DofB protein [Myxococcaceae bacterium GXIMD 01537]